MPPFEGLISAFLQASTDKSSGSSTSVWIAVFVAIMAGSIAAKRKKSIK